MCELTSPSSPPRSQSRQKRERRNDTSTPQHVWDDPPPVYTPRADGTWLQRKLVRKTPQRLATLCHEESPALCPPFIFRNQYIILATSQGSLLLFGKLDADRPWQNTAPLATLALDNDAEIVCMSTFSESSLLVLSAEGDLYKVTVTERSTGATSKDDAPEKSTIQFEVEDPMNTRSCGTNCFCVIPDGKNEVVIGYESGEVELWRMMKSKSQLRRTSLRLQWRGSVGASVQALTTLPHTVPVETSERQDKHNIYPDLLLSIVKQPRNDNEEVSCCVRSLDIGEAQASFELTDDVRSIDLEPLLKHPAPGMQILDNSTRSDSEGNPRSASVVPSSGTGSFVSLPNTTTAAALADGTIAILSPGFGVKEDSQQLLLTYPSIGNGFFQKGHDTMMVSCLRGGTAYAVSTDSETFRPVLVFSFPHNIDSNVSNTYVHGFVAGDLQLKNKKETPVFVYSFAEGSIDVYSANLSCPLVDNHSREDQVVQELLRNGSVAAILQLFDQMENDTSHSLWQSPSWVEARLCRTKWAIGELPTSDDLGRIENRSLVTLMLELCSVEDENENTVT